MKIGDYVRTQYGIAKITSVEENPKGEKTIYCCDNNIFDSDEMKYGELNVFDNMIDCFDTYFGDEKQIVKSSPDIIDLIEPQDLMYIDIDNGYAGGIVVPRIAETLDELNKYIDSFKKKELILVGVVTHEQLYSLVNKVGENNG